MEQPRKASQFPYNAGKPEKYFINIQKRKVTPELRSGGDLRPRRVDELLLLDAVAAVLHEREELVDVRAVVVERLLRGRLRPEGQDAWAAVRCPCMKASQLILKVVPVEKDRTSHIYSLAQRERCSN